MKRSAIIFSAANLLGIVLCWLSVASICGQARTEQREYYDFGDSITFILTAVPVFLACMLLDVVWGVMALLAFFRRRDYQPGVACLVAAVAWGLAYVSIRLMT